MPLNPSLLRPASTYTFNTSQDGVTSAPIYVNGAPIPNPATAVVTLIFTGPGGTTFTRTATRNADNSFAYTCTTTDFPVTLCGSWKLQWRWQQPDASPAIDITQEPPIFFEVRAA